MNWFTKMFDTDKGTGAVVDNRNEQEKLTDYKFEEIVSASDPVNWVEKKEKDWRKFPIFDQNGSGSCVAQTLAKLLGIVLWLRKGEYAHFSATHIYQRRKNKPASGMYATDAFDIARDGVTLEVLAPSQNLDDDEMDDYDIEDYKKQVGDIFKLPNYVELPQKDIDTIASTIQKTGKGVMVWFFFERSEWKREVPKITNTSLTTATGLRHSVTAVDYFMYEGKKCLLIEDSWGTDTGFEGRRIITEDFFKKRNWYAAYPIAFDFSDKTDDDTVDKPKYKFAEALEFGMNNEVVARLQDILKYEGLFPANVESTGYYGAITAKAVYDFQKKYAVASDSELDALAGRRVGGKTITQLNKLYG